MFLLIFGYSVHLKLILFIIFLYINWWVQYEQGERPSIYSSFAHILLT